MIPPEVTKAVIQYNLPGFDIQTCMQAGFSFQRADYYRRSDGGEVLGSGLSEYESEEKLNFIILELHFVINFWVGEFCANCVANIGRLA
jgi:hypothetical protein